MEVETRVERIIKVVEAKVIESLTRQHGRVRLKSYPIIRFISKKIFLGLPNCSQKKTLHAKTESDTLGLFEEDIINVIIIEDEDAYALE